MIAERVLMIRRAVIIAAILFTLGVYSYPALATWAKTGYTESPPILAPDVGFYTLISKLTMVRHGPILNPYYGVEVPPDGTAHLQFRLAFQLFGYVDTLFGGHIWVALLFGTCFGGGCFAGL